MLQLRRNIIIYLLATCAMTAQAESSDSPLSLLQARNFPALEKTLSTIQSDFESGKISEIELRNTYRPFYELDNALLNNIDEWEAKIPASYSAHLIRGIWYKRRGIDMRGTAYIQDTSPEALAATRQINATAKSELEKSLTLTGKPYLSTFHLMGISLNDGAREDSLALLNAGTECCRQIPC